VQTPLRADEDPEDSHDYLKALLDSMHDHRAWEAPFSVSIEHPMRDIGRYINFTSDARPSHVKEEPEEEDEEATMAWEYKWLIYCPP
jgi:hypothetical protein